jgi:hypothetical protein
MRRFFGKMGEGHMSKIRDFAALAQQWRDLEEAGIPLEPLENRAGINARSSGHVLTIRSGPHHPGRSEIRELRDGRFGYILSVFVRRDLPGETRIRDSWISPPWMDPTFEWLEDPKDEGQHPGWYAFPGDTEQFARVEVLNHRINCVLSRGDFREGLLLGVGCERPPDTYKNYDRVPVAFTIVDQWDWRHPGKLQMRMNRLPARAKEIYKRTRVPLFSRPDIIAPRRSLIAPSRQKISKKDAEAVRRAFEEMVCVSSKRDHSKVAIGSETR